MLNLQSGNPLVCTGTANLAGTLNLCGVTVPGELMTYASESGFFATVTGLPSGDRLVYTATQLDVAAIGASSVWALAVSGNWSDASKWAGGVPNGPSMGAVINAPSNSALTITLDTPQVLGTLKLGNSLSTTAGYTLSGSGANSLTLNNSRLGAMIKVDNGSHVIAAPVVLGDNLTVSGSGSLSFAAASSVNDNGAQPVSHAASASGASTYVRPEI